MAYASLLLLSGWQFEVWRSKIAAGYPNGYRCTSVRPGPRTSKQFGMAAWKDTPVCRRLGPRPKPRLKTKRRVTAEGRTANLVRAWP